MGTGSVMGASQTPALKPGRGAGALPTGPRSEETRQDQQRSALGSDKLVLSQVALTKIEALATNAPSDKTPVNLPTREEVEAAGKAKSSGEAQADTATKASKKPLQMSDDQLDMLLRGKESLVLSPVLSGGVIKSFQVVGVGVDHETWNRMGNPEGFMPLAYMRTRMEIGPIGADIIIKGKHDGDGGQNVSFGVKDIRWERLKVEDIAKDWAMNWLDEHPGQAIPTFIAVGAAGLVGAYFYAQKEGPIDFSVGSLRILKIGDFEAKVKGKAEFGGDSIVGFRGAELNLKYKIPESYGDLNLKASYELEHANRFNDESRLRLEANYSLPLGKKNQGYFGVGAWGEPETGDYGAGAYLSFRF